jgi:hypothetical protein
VTGTHAHRSLLRFAYPRRSVVRSPTHGLGFGPRDYFGNPQNWFDAVIVIVSFIEIAMGGEGPWCGRACAPHGVWIA